MKLLIIAASIFMVQQSQALAQALVVGCFNDSKTVSVFYNQSKFAYSHNDGDKPFRVLKDENQITSTKTVLGTMITARNSDLSVPDKEDYYISFILPDINLDSENTKATFTSQTIETVVKTTIAGPQGVKGTVQSSKYFPVTCSAVSQ